MHSGKGCMEVLLWSMIFDSYPSLPRHSENVLHMKDDKSTQSVTLLVIVEHLPIKILFQQFFLSLKLSCHHIQNPLEVFLIVSM